MWQWDTLNNEWTCEESSESSFEDDNLPFQPVTTSTGGGSSEGSSSSESENQCSTLADVTVIGAGDITITYPDEVSPEPGKVIKRDVREKAIVAGGAVAVQHHVIVPFKIDVKVPAGKTVKISYEAYVANIGIIRGMGGEQVIKKLSMGGGTFDATGDTAHVAVADYDKIKSAFDAAPPADHLGADGRYGIMIVVRQLAQDDQGQWNKYYKDSQTYKSIFMSRTVPAPALMSDNNILKP